jgi:hypothetical protein
VEGISVSLTSLLEPVNTSNPDFCSKSGYPLPVMSLTACDGSGMLMSKASILGDGEAVFGKGFTHFSKPLIVKDG